MPITDLATQFRNRAAYFAIAAVRFVLLAAARLSAL